MSTTNSRTVLFDSIFKNKEIGEMFYSFLKEDKSEESWEFLQSLYQLSKNEPKLAEKKIEDIIQQHLLPTAPKSLNISAETRKEVLENLNKHKSIDHLRPLENVLIQEMKYDSFKRFLRSKQCNKIIEKYSNNQSVVASTVSEKFSYADSDFSKAEITEHDLKFMNYLLKDNMEWELLASFREGEYGKRVGNTWYSQTNYLPLLKIIEGMSISKYEIILPFAFMHVICSYFPLSQQLKIDPHLTKYDTYAYTKDKGRSYATIMKHLNFGFPLNTRLSPTVSTAFFDASTHTLYLISKPCDVDVLKEHPWMVDKEALCVQKKGENPKSAKAYRMFDFQCTSFQQIDPFRTLVSQVHLFSLGGWAKQKASLKNISKERGNSLLIGLVNNIKSTPANVQISDLKKRKSFTGDGTANLLMDLEEEINKNMIKEDVMDEEK